MDIPAPPTKIRRKSRRLFVWLKWILIVCAVLIGLVGLITVSVRYAYLSSMRGRTAQVIEKLDKSDPNWRFEAIEAGRKVVPAEVNSATPLLAANRLIPSRWPQISATVATGAKPSPEAQEQAGRIRELFEQDPFLPLDPKQLEALRAELKALAPVLAEARKVVNKPEGRYEIAWALDPLKTELPHAQKASSTTRLLKLDSIRRVHDGDPNGGLASCRAALNVGRSLGDEPLLITQLVREAIESVSIWSIEHVLAFGEPSEPELAAIQALLEDEEKQPLFRYGIRGERGALNDLYARLASGELEQMGDTEAIPAPIQWLYGEAIEVYSQGIILEEMTDAIAIADAPLSEQHGRAEEWGRGIGSRTTQSTLDRTARLLLPAIQSAVDNYVTSRTRLRTAIVAIAAERYRLKNGRWPETAEALKPWPLSEIPTDPHTNKPLKWKRSGETLVIYSPGLDLVDNGAALEQGPKPARNPSSGPQPKKPQWEGQDIGFRLRDPAARKPPPATESSPASQPSQ